MLSLVLSMALVFCAVSGVSATAYAAPTVSYVDITVGGSATVNITGRSITKYIRFKAPDNKVYAFYSDASSDTYGYLFDSDLNELGYNDDYGDDSDFRLVRSMKKDEVVYIGATWYSSGNSGDITVYCEEVDVNNLSRLYVYADDIYVMNNKPINNLNPRFYMDGNQINDVKYTTKYMTNDDYDYDSDVWTEGTPSVPGEYVVRFEGVAPYYGYKDCVVDVNDFSSIKNWSLLKSSFYYGTPITEKDIVVGARVYDDDTYKYRMVYTLVNGKDYKIDGYCSYNTYNNWPASTIKWKQGFPTAVGDYCLKISTIGAKSESGYFEFSINRAVNPEETIYTQLKSPTNNVSINSNSYTFFEIKPNVTAEYTIYANKSKKIDYYSWAYLFDQYGNNIEIPEQYVDSNKYIFSIKSKLTAGTSYYLCISSESNNDEEDIDFIRPITINIAGSGTTYSWYTPPAPKPTPAPGPQALKKGKTFTVGKLKYKVTKSDGNKSEVTLVKNLNKKAKKVTIKNTVKYKNVTYKVTGINSKAFFKNKKTVTVNIKATGIKTIGTNAFNNMNDKTKIKLPKSKKKLYKKLLKKAKTPKKYYE